MNFCQRTDTVFWASSISFFLFLLTFHFIYARRKSAGFIRIVEINLELWFLEKKNTCWMYYFGCYIRKRDCLNVRRKKRLVNRKNLFTSSDRTLISYVFRRRRNFPIIQFSRKVISVMYDTFRVPFCPFG